MVFKNSQPNFEGALATFVIGELDRKTWGRSNRWSEVKTPIVYAPFFGQMTPTDYTFNSSSKKLSGH